MPEISRFHNIIVCMQFSDTGKHHKPHVHVLYSEYQAVMGLDGERRRFDMTPFLAFPVFAPLRDPKIFREVSVGYGTTLWCGGEIDLAPELMLEQGQPISA